MKEFVEKLKAHLSENKDNYVIWSSMNGSTEGGFYDSEDFDLELLLEEIDEFSNTFKAD